MRKQTWLAVSIALSLLMLMLWSGSSISAPPTPPGLDRLRQDAVGELEITWSNQLGSPSFIRGRIPVQSVTIKSQVDPAETAIAFLGRYGEAFGLNDPLTEMELTDAHVDELGMTHVTLRQVYQGVEVYGAQIKVHLSANGEEVVAISNGFVPGIALPGVKPQVSAGQAVITARMALPKGEPTFDPKLVVYPGAGSRRLEVPARLAWLVGLRDEWPPVNNAYVVDASNGIILDVLDRLYEERSRRTYTADNGTDLPGRLCRSEGGSPSGDGDCDNAHDFAGDTYNYYRNTHSRDSYDNRGASMISTVHYGGRGYCNARWEPGRQQTVYADGLAVKDVVAHEWTHAAIQYSAGLEYEWQSGALNESFSDIFGAMVDRDDWLMGEDVADSAPDCLAGREAIRDLSNPPRFGQPDHTQNWVQTCSDNEGVHTNSGITNKAYYNIATAIGKDKAERIFYRALTEHLGTTSSLEDARAAALQSAQDLYGSNSNEYNAVRNGFNAVGLDGNWNPPENDCTCSATATLSDTKLYPDRMSAIQIAATLYRTRDQLLQGTSSGQRYIDLYYEHIGRISYLLLRNAKLRALAGQILQDITPGLTELLEGHGEQVRVTQDMISELEALLASLAEADEGGELAKAIGAEQQRTDLARLAGLTFEEAWQILSQVK